MNSCTAKRRTPAGRHEVMPAPCRHCPLFYEGPDPACEDALVFIAQGLTTPEEQTYVCAWGRGRCHTAAKYFGFSAEER